MYNFYPCVIDSNMCRSYVKENLPAVRWAPVLLVSALTGQRCPKIYDAIDEAVKNHRTRVRFR